LEAKFYSFTEQNTHGEIQKSSRRPASEDILHTVASY